MIHDPNVSLSDEPAASLPPQLQLLAWRERQIASIIYLEGPMTAKALEARLSDSLSNAAIRSMLVRLCNKRILKRRKRMILCREGARRIAYIYLPAIGTDDVRQNALRQFAEDYFGGSLLMVAQVSIGLLHDEPEAEAMPGMVNGRPARGETRTSLPTAL